ncbi:MAG: DNA-binding response OmpR family regulator [Cellvibrionaceae bacterium]
MYALLISENAEERDILTQSLRQVGMQILAHKDSSSLLDYSLIKPVDLVVVTTETYESALKYVKDVRTVTQIPLVIILNLLTEKEHCLLLDSGADMIFPRPIATRLFLRYSKLLLRRGAGIPPALLEPIHSASVVLDPGRRAVILKKAGQDDRVVRLTQLEFRLLYVLMINEGQVMPTKELVEKVWGYTGEGNRDLVRGLVRRLRKKIEPETARKDSTNHLIQNLPGVGYRFNTED